MKKLISFPSIEALRNVVHTVNIGATYTGKDEYGNPVYDENLLKPTLTFEGTIKLHGTNAAVCFNNVDDFWAQSRESIITPQKDNAGFAFFAEARKEVLINLIKQLSIENSVDLNEKTITVYGEWVGKGIQKGVAISEIEKSFFIFGAKVSDITPTEDSIAKWINHTTIKSVKDRIYNINDYRKYSITIDFNNPSDVLDKLNDLTLEVENECPVAKEFGISGIGEGIVFVTEYQNSRLLFKSKGAKHSVTKTVQPNSISPERLESIEKFVEYAVGTGRFEQAVEKVCGGKPEIKQMGQVIQWVIADIIKEEMDVLIENNIEPKEVNKYVSPKVREMFNNYLNESIMK